MFDLERYKKFIEKTISDSPEYMMIEENSENLLVFDRFVTAINENAMPWLFKVLLDTKYNILKGEEFTANVLKEYKDVDLKIIDKDGNLFLNSIGMCVILSILEANNEIKFDSDALSIEFL